jgi:hypothetical protein
VLAKISKMLRIGYPLSESVAPPGTAWDAEGPRGNEANENKLMVLARALPRKSQSNDLFAQEDMTVQVGLQLTTSEENWPPARFLGDGVTSSP